MGITVQISNVLVISITCICVHNKGNSPIKFKFLPKQTRNINKELLYTQQHNTTQNKQTQLINKRINSAWGRKGRMFIWKTDK